MKRAYRVYQNRHTGSWRWQCQVCPRLDRNGNQLPGKVVQGGYSSFSEAQRAYAVDHRSTAAHQAEEERWQRDHELVERLAQALEQETNT